MNRSTLQRCFTSWLIVCISVACRSERSAPDSATINTKTAGNDSVSKMAAMPGMSRMTAAGAMMDSMEAHMRAMTAARPDQLKARLPMHRQMVANTISQMNQEMRAMNMPANAAWSATVDSVRQDLIRMPDMSSRDLAARLPEHHTRVTRLLQMHRDMVAKMK